MYVRACLSADAQGVVLWLAKMPEPEPMLETMGSEDDHPLANSYYLDELTSLIRNLTILL